MIKQIKMSNWRQFDNLTINFDEHLTILTRVNGSGKTTILNILSEAFGDFIKLVSNVSETSDGSIGCSSGVIGDLKERRDNNYQFSVNGNITYPCSLKRALISECPCYII